MKTKNMRKKALMSSLAMLLVAVVALSSATYAWFTSSKEATISQITVTAESSSGIQVSATGTGDWNTYLEVPSTEVPATFKPVSVFADNLGTANFYKGTVSTATTGANIGQQVISFATSAPSGTAVTAVNSNNSASTNDYLVKHFFVKVDQAETLKVSQFAVSAVSGHDGVDPIIRAARIGVVNHGTVNKTNLAGGESWLAATPAWVYEPEATTHNDATVTGARTTYAVNVAPSDGTLLSTVFDTAYSAGEPAVDYTKAVTVNNTSTPAEANYAKINLTKGITWLTLYIWIEGQDTDCLNEISGGSFNVDMKVSIDA